MGRLIHLIALTLAVGLSACLLRGSSSDEVRSVALFARSVESPAEPIALDSAAAMEALPARIDPDHSGLTAVGTAFLTIVGMVALACAADPRWGSSGSGPASW